MTSGDAPEVDAHPAERTAGLRVAVIGGGIAGLSSARVLREQGVEVTVFDKGRGFGGRLSTRRVELEQASPDHHLVLLDHGAPFFTVRDDRFARVVHSWTASGIAAAWHAQRSKVTAGSVASTAPGPPLFVGVPRSSAICAHLGRDLDVRFNAPAAGVRHRGGHWWLDFDGLGPQGPWDAVVLAIPAPQAITVIGGASATIAGALNRIVYAPQWTGLCVIGAEPKLDADVIEFGDHPVLALLVRNDRKPGRTSTPRRSTWVAYARPDWSAANLEREKEAIAEELFDHLAELLGIRESSRLWTTAHRWRFARVETAIDDRCAPDPEQSIVACGDGFGGNDVESAFLSGQAAAERVLSFQRE